MRKVRSRNVGALTAFVFVCLYYILLPQMMLKASENPAPHSGKTPSARLRVSIRNIENHTSYAIQDSVFKAAQLSLVQSARLMPVNAKDNPEAFLDIIVDKLTVSDKNTQAFILLQYKLYDAKGRRITETEMTDEQFKLSKGLSTIDDRQLLVEETLNTCMTKGIHHLGVLVSNVGEVAASPSKGRIFVKFLYPSEVKKNSRVLIECKGAEKIVCGEGIIESTGLEHSVIKLAKGDVPVGMGDSVRIVSNPNPPAKHALKKANNSVLTTGLAIVGALGIVALLGGKKGATTPSASTATGETTASSITLSVSPTTLTADGTSTSTVTATVKDSSNAAVTDGTAVSFQTTGGTLIVTGGGSVAKTTNGVATATLTAPTTAGSATVSAVSGTATSNSVTVTFSAASTQNALVSSIELSTTVVSANDQSGTTLAINSTQGTAQTTVKAVAKDSSGNALNNVTISLSTTLGNITSPLTTATVGAETGVALSPYSTTKSGTATVSATSGSVSSTLTLTVNAGTAKQVTVAASPASILADANASSTITVNVTDISGNPVSDGTQVNFTVTADANSGGNGSITPSSLTTAGVATAVLTSRDPNDATAPYTASNSGTATVTVTVPSTSITNAGTQVVFVSKVAQYIAVAAESRNVRGLDFVGTPVKITALVYDVNRNPVADGTTVYFTTNHGMIIGDGTSAEGVTSAITAAGAANVTLYTAGSQNESENCTNSNNAAVSLVANGTITGGTLWNWCGIVAFRAYSGNASGTNTTMFTGPANINFSSIATSPAAVANLQSRGDSLTITVIAHDINGNPVVDGTAVKIETSKATLDATNGVTTGGVFIAKLKTADLTSDNPTASGLGTITAQIDTGGYAPITLTVTFNVL